MKAALGAVKRWLFAALHESRKSTLRPSLSQSPSIRDDAADALQRLERTEQERVQLIHQLQVEQRRNSMQSLAIHRLESKVFSEYAFSVLGSSCFACLNAILQRAPAA